MNQKFFASLTGKYMRVLALLFVLFGAAQQLSAQSLVSPTTAYGRLKSQYGAVDMQLRDLKGPDTQIGMLSLRLEYYKLVTGFLSEGIETQQALNKSALSLAENFTKLPNTTIPITATHITTVQTETTGILTN